ncbi:MAG: patatin-like phospholipase family protein [Elainellaceae cyanobacterium]
MPPRRNIALVIAGGASLGSYEAGVMTELLYALEYLNRTRKPNEPEYVIDVITGGSAGALTAALTARIMMYDTKARSRLYEAWVERIDIVELMRRAPGNAILSKEVIRSLAQELIVDGTGEVANRTDVASFAPRALRLGLSLSNMNGIDYALPALSSAMATGRRDRPPLSQPHPPHPKRRHRKRPQTDGRPQHPPHRHPWLLP